MIRLQHSSSSCCFTTKITDQRPDTKWTRRTRASAKFWVDPKHTASSVCLFFMMEDMLRGNACMYVPTSRNMFSVAMYYVDASYSCCLQLRIEHSNSHLPTHCYVDCYITRPNKLLYCVYVLCSPSTCRQTRYSTF